MDDTAAGAWTDTVGFELVAFERAGEDVHIRVRGMASPGVELLVFEDDAKATITPVAPCLGGAVREFDVRTTVSIVPGKRLVVRGLMWTETVMAEDLAEGYPVVCGADPTAPGLPDQFLHRRGDRYVLMTNDRPTASRSAGRTTLVA